MNETYKYFAPLNGSSTAGCGCASCSNMCYAASAENNLFKATYYGRPGQGPEQVALAAERLCRTATIVYTVLMILFVLFIISLTIRMIRSGAAA